MLTALTDKEGAVSRRESGAATVYQKHKSAQTRNEDVCRLTRARCRKVKARGHAARQKLRTEAPVNGGRNYDGPKVAKFLVG